VLHTNLGRAPLGAAVLQRMLRIGEGYCNLEYELEQKKRGSRQAHAAELLCELSGAEDALVVNNNAAAVLIGLTALAKEREVVVSRGELVEIGGSFRMPDVMASSGARLREVGTTNRTHAVDYERALGPETALLLKVHRSNFAMVGFTAEVSSSALVALGRAHGILTMYDLGSGSLMDFSIQARHFSAGETVPQAVKAGFDLVTFSGDKLLGGPQAGLIVGRAECVGRLRSHPLMRPLRPDKMTLAALEATLELYREGQALTELPTLAMLFCSEAVLKRRASRLRGALKKACTVAGWDFRLVSLSSRVGGGALPEAELSSWAVALRHPRLSAQQLERRLRQSAPPIIARIVEDCVLLDVRTITDEQLGPLVKSAAAALMK
jgi:L-seryl-tRNA(Ser) seleniumtransferase